MIPIHLPEIRPVKPGELPEVLELYAELEGDGKTTDLAHAQALFARIQRYPDYTVYVAVVDETIVGTFALLIMDNLAHQGIPSGIVEDVVVASTWRGQGIGKQMMLFAMEHCRKAGCYKLVLSSNLKRDEAHRFYETLGFEKHGFSFVVSLSS